MYFYSCCDPVNLRNGDVGIRERQGPSVHISVLQVTQNARGRYITSAEATGGAWNKRNSKVQLNYTCVSKGAK